ncbi:DgyrCDS3145 [Dimorphilus gyrociliatus]|uniref:Hexosyltransferase n=1 Tax=Dimorphilus gyrociliatus TaxID=2664684 RepID=A0A7I8VCP6_9ANNE|nr:DgyrCDS3145 [Dimorphilus gyrociliatus]
MDRKKKRRIEYERTLFFLAGIFIGFYIPSFVIHKGFCYEEGHLIEEESLGEDLQPRINLYVGVMTSEKYITSRAVFVNNTWGKPLYNHLDFYTSSELVNVKKVKLEGVDDSEYPPQKKSFRMLKYWCENYLDKYDWFLRADDDSYINMEKLKSWLVTIDSRRAFMIGHPGQGKAEKKGKIGISSTDYYCMGGPGVLFSRVALKRICPYIKTCERSVVSRHEDVEIGRCVLAHAGIGCSKSFELSTLFFSNYANNSNYFKANPEVGNLKSTLKDSLTMHAIKDVRYAYRIDFIILKNKVEKLKKKISTIYSALSGKVKEHQFDITKNNSWNTIANFKKFYQNYKEKPIVYMQTTGKIEILFFFQEVLYYLHNLIKRSYIIKNIPTVYRHFSPSNGLTYATDIRLEVDKKKSILQLKGTRKFSSIQSRILDVDDSSPITIVIPLFNKKEAFDRFLKMWISQAMDRNVHLLFTISKADKHLNIITNTINRFSASLPYGMSISYIVKDGDFSRGPILNYGSQAVPDHHIMCFLDVDLKLTKSTLRRIRASTIKGKQVYFPIMFSQFDSDFNKIYDGHNKNNGYWRESSFGQVCLYKTDFTNSLKLTESIYEWGKEDLEFAEQIIKKKILTIFRSPDVGITHIFHSIHCDRIINEEQKKMCIAVKYRTYASQNQLANKFYSSINLLNINNDNDQ